MHHFPTAPKGISAALSRRTHAAVIRNACKKVVEMLDSQEEQNAQSLRVPQHEQHTVLFNVYLPRC